MGAEFFVTQASGRTPSEAFAAARDAAGFEHGRGGYSGTICEKGDFRMMSLPASIPVLEFVNHIESKTRTRFAQLGEAELALMSAKERVMATTARFGDQWLPARHYEEPLPEAWLREQPRFRAAFDKWGPALALELHGQELEDARARFDKSRPRQVTYDRRGRVTSDVAVGPSGRDVRHFVFFGLAPS